MTIQSTINYTCLLLSTCFKGVNKILNLLFLRIWTDDMKDLGDLVFLGTTVDIKLDRIIKRYIGRIMANTCSKRIRNTLKLASTAKQQLQ
jgi:hypothetical protein